MTGSMGPGRSLIRLRFRWPARRLVAEAIGVARAVGATPQLLVRADSAFCSTAVLTACRRAKACFSVTIRSDRTVRAAIAAIPDAAWTGIRYPQAVWDDDGQCWVSDAKVAETIHTMCAHTRRAVTCRLVVRLIRAADPERTGELFRSGATTYPSAHAALRAQELLRLGERLDRAAEERAEDAARPSSEERAERAEKESRRLRKMLRRRPSG